MSFPEQDLPKSGSNQPSSDLQERLQLFQSILDQLPDPIEIVDRDFNVVYMNASARRRNGLETQRPSGTKCHQVFYNRSEPCSFCSASEAFETGKSDRIILRDIQLRGAESCYEELLLIPLKTDRGDVYCIVEIAKDLARERKFERQPVEIQCDFQKIIGQSRPMKELFRLIGCVADSNCTILIEGESGTGKELIARAIHSNSPRRQRPFVAIDCGALPETLLESELFGHVQGSFTGAIHAKKGLFEEAHVGTLFLDEIGDTTLAFQAKLLRVLQEGEIRPVGSNKCINVDVRVLAATNKDLKERVKKKTFREDLYYRLAVVPIMIPPLRERKEDIPLLADHFIKKYCNLNRIEPKRISTQVMKVLMDYPWHGNVRELENVIERTVLMSPGPEIDLDTLFLERAASEESFESLSEITRTAAEQVERIRIAQAMQRAKGNRSDTARLLGISRATLYNKLRRYDLTQ